MTARVSLQNLNGKKVSKSELNSLLDLAKLENDTATIYRLMRTIKMCGHDEECILEVQQFENNIGLSGPKHSGAYRLALDSCGRLRPGYKFENGEVVKVVKKVRIKKTTLSSKKIIAPKKIVPAAKIKAPKKQIQPRKIQSKSTPRAKVRIVKSKKDLEKINPKPYAQKPKSISVATAIKDILSLPKFKGISVLTASILFKHFKNVAPEDFQFSIEIGSDYDSAILDKNTALHTYIKSIRELELTSKGVQFIESVKGRLESLKNQKENYALFSLNGKKKPKKPALNCPVAESDPVQIIPTVNTIPTVVEDKKVIVIPKSNNPLVKSSSDLMDMNFESLEFSGQWADFMQEPARNMKIAIWGAPKNGKTAGSLQFADYLTKFGKVLYNFADQGYNKSTRDLWKLTGLDKNSKAFSTDVRDLESLDKLCASGEYQFVFIDMISTYIERTKIKPGEFDDRFIKKYPKISFILIFEVTKGGNFKGDQGWTHLVDAIVTVEDYLMINRGRYGVGHHIVWDEGFKKFNPTKHAELKPADEPEIKPVLELGFAITQA